MTEKQLPLIPLLDTSQCRQCLSGHGAVDETTYFSSGGRVAIIQGGGDNPPVLAAGVSSLAPCLRTASPDTLCIGTWYGGEEMLGTLNQDVFPFLGYVLLAEG